MLLILTLCLCHENAGLELVIQKKANSDSPCSFFRLLVVARGNAALYQAVSPYFQLMKECKRFLVGDIG